MSELLKSLKGNEQIAQVAQDKWATVRDSLRSIIINEQMSDALKNFWLNKSKILFFSMLCIGFLNKKMSDLLIPSFLVSDVSESLRSLTKNERCEQIAQVAHQKWATIKFAQVSQSESLVFLSELLICYFLGKKRAIHSENQWANSQPCSGMRNLQISNL